MNRKPRTKEAALAAFRKWSMDLKKQADNPEYVGTMEVELWSDHKLAEYTSELMQGVDDYYLCRKKDCALVLPNTHWIECEGHAWYRCPACSTQYRPWVQQPSLMQAQKCLVVEDGAKVTFHLMMWPDTSTQVLMNRLKSINLELKQKVDGLSTDKALEVVKQEVNKLCHRSYFQDMHLTQEIKDTVAWLNSTSNTKWKYDRIEDGFKGVKYAYNDAHPVLSQDDVIRMFGYTKFVLEQANKGGKK